MSRSEDWEHQVLAVLEDMSDDVDGGWFSLPSISPVNDVQFILKVLTDNDVLNRTGIVILPSESQAGLSEIILINLVME